MRPGRRALIVSHTGLLDRPGGGERVELVRVVEAGRLGRPRSAGIVVARDGVQQLRAHLAFELCRRLLDEPQAEMDVTQQAPLLGDLESWAGLEFTGAADEHRAYRVGA